MSWREEAKKHAAFEAVKHVHDGQIVGLGTGSTAYYAIMEIGRRVREESLKIWGISTSAQSSTLAKHAGIPLTTLNNYPRIDVAIDGADQVDLHLNLIKGMGGALTREKIVDSAANTLIIIVDATKLTSILGRDQAIPVEVLPFAQETVIKRLSELGGTPTLRRLTIKSPYVTDNGNHILDVNFGTIKDPKSLEIQIKMIPGVIEVGLFTDMTHLVYVGYETQVEKLRRKV